MLTPGMAPNSMPPITPPRKIKMPTGSLNRAIVPFRKLVNASTRALLDQRHQPVAEIIEGVDVPRGQAHVQHAKEQKK